MISYTNREQKAKYTVLKYRDFLEGKVLDVGCSGRYLKKYLSDDIEYIGIDITGNPDIFVDLEKQKIPFPDNVFDCVVCTDVLEHLDNIHEVFDELLRVSNRYIIISLPNCYSSSIKKILTGRKGLKFYGLPIEKTKDRHKWFFTYEEIEEFILKRAVKNGAKVIEMYPTNVKPLRSFIFRILLGKRYKNLAYPCLWALIQK
jgi:2-polyprenyl-3-methyl-5-hydroxy-6-metoxy-1,4-benzoquinol methylase